jgi:hypothetical protein
VAHSQTGSVKEASSGLSRAQQIQSNFTCSLALGADEAGVEEGWEGVPLTQHCLAQPQQARFATCLESAGDADTTEPSSRMAKTILKNPFTETNRGREL